MMQPSDQQPTKLQKVMMKYPLYVRIVWAMIIMFGVVGQLFAGGTKPMLILIMTALAWTMVKIMNEATDALDVLRRIKKAELEISGSKSTGDGPSA